MLATGLFALGTFVGTIITMGIEKIDNWSNLQKILGVVFSAAFAGVILAFIRLSTGTNIEAVASYYPIGLFYGMLWFYARAAVAHVRSGQPGLVLLGWLHICGLALSILFAGLLFLSPEFRNLLP